MWCPWDYSISCQDSARQCRWQWHPNDNAAEFEFDTKKLVKGVIYENLDTAAIYKVARKVNGPSGADSDLWQRLICLKQHKKKPAGLCEAIAALARSWTQMIDSVFPYASLCCRKIDSTRKITYVRPIDIGKVLRRIVGSATMTVLEPELLPPLHPCKHELCRAYLLY